MTAPPEAFGAALAGLPAMGPARLRALVEAWGLVGAWPRVVAGRAHTHPTVATACRPDPAAVARAWRDAAATVDPPAVLAAHRAAGVTVTHLGGPGYPAALADDHQAPAVLFATGDLAVVDAGRPAVALIGTRAASRYGREVARELARDLAGAGVVVVSGLALGIDGAAHTGALEAGGATVAVVGSGLDVVYPRAHAALWRAIAGRGLVVGEAPLGTRPEPWRFPVRNRVIAALARTVVVVESPHRGGSLHTVEAAAARGVPVMAVPGPVRSRGSELPNALLAEGCAPARDALDVLVALDLAGAAAFVPPSPKGPDPMPRGVDPGPEARAVLDAIGWAAATFEEIVVRSTLPPGQAGVALAALEREGAVVAAAGRWERAR